MHVCVELLPCLLEFLGCGQLFVTDGLWKLDYPVCIYRQYNNTKPAKAIFINMDDLTEPTRAALKAGKLFTVYDN